MNIFRGILILVFLVLGLFGLSYLFQANNVVLGLTSISAAFLSLSYGLAPRPNSSSQAAQFGMWLSKSSYAGSAVIIIVTFIYIGYICVSNAQQIKPHGRQNRCAVSPPVLEALLCGVREYLGSLNIAGFVKVLASAKWVVQVRNRR